LKYLEVPKYRIRPRPGRFLVDKLFVLIILSALLYLGIYVNYYLLNTKIPSYLNVLFIVGIIFLVIMELLLCYVKYGNYAYEFYDSKIVVDDGKIHEINYSDVHAVHYSSNFLDKEFSTGSIIIELKNKHKIKLKYLDSPNQAYFLMQKHLK
jgi:hypothetical protein